MTEASYGTMIHLLKNLRVMIVFMGKTCLHHHLYLLTWFPSQLLLVEEMKMLTEGLELPDMPRGFLLGMTRKNEDDQKKIPWFHKMIQNEEKKMMFVRESEKSERGCQLRYELAANSLIPF
jgi:hypothetical protein